MIVFGVVAHLPFITIQRYNRERLLRDPGGGDGASA